MFSTLSCFNNTVMSSVRIFFVVVIIQCDLLLYPICPRFWHVAPPKSCCSLDAFFHAMSKDCWLWIFQVVNSFWNTMIKVNEIMFSSFITLHQAFVPYLHDFRRCTDATWLAEWIISWINRCTGVHTKEAVAYTVLCIVPGGVIKSLRMYS